MLECTLNFSEEVGLRDAAGDAGLWPFLFERPTFRKGVFDGEWNGSRSRYIQEVLDYFH